MPALPAQMSFFTVTGKLVKATLDSADGDTDPDSVALQGQVTFSPEIGKRLSNGTLAGGGRITVASATPPLIVVVDPVPVVLDVNGAFSVKLLAPDDPDISPSGWSWTCTFALTGATIKAFSFTGEAGSTVDLATVVPAEIGTGSALFINEAAASAAAAEASAVSAALSASLVGAPADVAVAAIVGNPASATSTELSSTYGLADPVTAITYNGDGTVASVTEDGMATTYTYNGDGTVATQTRLGVTRTFTYDGGNLTAVA